MGARTRDRKDAWLASWRWLQGSALHDVGIFSSGHHAKPKKVSVWLRQLSGISNQKKGETSHPTYANTSLYDTVTATNPYHFIQQNVF